MRAGTRAALGCLAGLLVACGSTTGTTGTTVTTGTTGTAPTSVVRSTTTSTVTTTVPAASTVPVTVTTTAAASTTAVASTVASTTSHRPTTTTTAVVWDVDPYRGIGAWVDVFDYVPVYSKTGVVPLTADAVDQMADLGIRTLYLQVARLDEKGIEGITAPSLAGAFLQRAHARGMAVVAWYLPKLYDLEADRSRLLALRDFTWGGHRFDGIGVDIEFREGVADVAERNRRLVELSSWLREEIPRQTIAAIVLPPVVTEVVNPVYWPDFPWSELAGLYDVWMPMSYWTYRTAASGWRDGYAYTAENIERLRANLGRADAIVHPVGGLSDVATASEIEGFARAVAETGSIGASLYDFAITPAAYWELLTAG